MKAKTMFSMYGVALAMSSPCKALGPVRTRQWVCANRNHALYEDAYTRMMDMKPVTGATQTAVVEGNDVVLESVLDARVQWLSKGTQCDLDCGPGVELTKGVTVYDNSMAVSIETKSGVTVWIVAGHLAASRLRLHAACCDLAAKANTFSPSSKYQGVRFPEVPKTTRRIDLKELLGIRTGAYKCTAASQDLEFEMDVVGARAKAQTVVRMTKGLSKPFFTIDGPFTLFMCQGQDEPFFAATFSR